MRRISILVIPWYTDHPDPSDLEQLACAKDLGANLSLRWPLIVREALYCWPWWRTIGATVVDKSLLSSEMEDSAKVQIQNMHPKARSWVGVSRLGCQRNLNIPGNFVRNST
jgi:hypothetical protein